jgi:hypothetical protein
VPIARAQPDGYTGLSTGRTDITGVPILRTLRQSRVTATSPRSKNEGCRFSGAGEGTPRRGGVPILRTMPVVT